MTIKAFFKWVAAPARTHFLLKSVSYMCSWGRSMVPPPIILFYCQRTFHGWVILIPIFSTCQTREEICSSHASKLSDFPSRCKVPYVAGQHHLYRISLVRHVELLEAEEDDGDGRESWLGQIHPSWEFGHGCLAMVTLLKTCKRIMLVCPSVRMLVFIQPWNRSEPNCSGSDYPSSTD